MDTLSGKVRGILKWVLIGLLSVVFSACAQKEILSPVPEQTIDTLMIPLESVFFKAEPQNWKVNLRTFTQPIPLAITYTDTGFRVQQKNQAGIIGGPGKLHFQTGKQHFFYDVYLKNRTDDDRQAIDYRSPKTVNPDSSLSHQKIVLAKNQWSGVIPLQGSNNFFEETEVQIAAQTGVYYAQKDTPISAYYVQAGSCVEIPIQVQYLKNENQFEIEAGPLLDAYGNEIADGTQVSFHYTDGQYSYRMEAASFRGFAVAKIPTDTMKHYSVFAQINTTLSSTLQLKPI